MKFSLVVTCFNEIESLPLWHQDIITQSRHPDEIVVVDSESTDGTTEFLMDWSKRDPRVKVIVEKCKPARGHNVGNEAAEFDCIVSTDMGVRLDRHWFEEITKPFENDSSVEVVTGNTQINKETMKGVISRAEYYIENGGDFKFEPGFVPLNRSVAYMKRVWRELGGLPEDLTFYADDAVFGRQIVQAGFKMAIAPKAMTYWERFHKLRDFCREQYNYGYGDGEARIKTPFVFKIFERKFIPRSLVSVLHGLRIVQKKIDYRIIIRAIKNKDILTIPVIPLLLFCRGYFFAKGYLKGDIHGRLNCQKCRERLRRPDHLLSIPE